SAAFGVLAVVLAAVGLYGVMAYAMSRRTGEIGIRMALGAQPRDIRWMALSEALRLICAGVMIGVPVALVAGTFVQRLLDGIRTIDPWVLSEASLSLVAVALVAGWLPPPAQRVSTPTPRCANAELHPSSLVTQSCRRVDAGRAPRRYVTREN